MKLAEALLLRADIQKRIASLKSRIVGNTVYQEGETPSEDPKALIEETHRAARRLGELVVAINRANLEVQTPRGRSLTEALAERDTLAIRHGMLVEAAASAGRKADRYGMSEIRWVRAVEPADLQKRADDLAKAIREVNAEIQEANWSAEIPDVE